MTSIATRVRRPTPSALVALLATLTLGAGAISPVAAGAQQPTPPPAYGARGARLEPTTAVAEARREFEAGRRDADFLNVTPALRHLGRALELDSALTLARVLRASGDPALTTDQRRAEYRRAADGAAARGATGERLYAAMHVAMADRRPKDAQLLADSLAALFPGDPRVALEQANRATAVEGQRAGVVRIFDVTKRFPDYAPAYNTLAYARLAIGDTAGALAAAAEQVKRAPADEPNPYDTYAEMLMRARRLDEADVNYKKSLATKPEAALFYRGPAILAQTRGRGDEARALLAQALERATGGDRVTTMEAMAASYLYDGRQNEAMAKLAAAAAEADRQHDPELVAEVQGQTAFIDAALGDGTEAVEHVGRSVEADQRTSDYFRAITYAYLHQPDRANAAIDAIERRATDEGRVNALAPQLHLLRGLSALYGGDANAAMQHLQAANAGDALVLEAMGEAYKKLGKTVDARAMRNRVLAPTTTADLDNFQTVVARGRAKKM
jgi:tetratricopeptide (TPR) repeat protein